MDAHQKPRRLQLKATTGLSKTNDTFAAPGACAQAVVAALQSDTRARLAGTSVMVPAPP